MPPEAIKESVALIKGVVEELTILREILRRMLLDEDLGKERKDRVQRLLAGAELPIYSAYSRHSRRA